METDASRTLRVAKVRPDVQLPERGSAGAAGLDLHSDEEVIIESGGRAVIDTGLYILVPRGTYGRIAARSGLAADYGLQVGAGVIVRDYRGSVKVLLFNLGKENCRVPKNTRIAQLVCEKIARPKIELVASLPQSARGEGGFGSTGQ